MTSMFNVGLHTHSMNGIITLSDGMGTIIENNTIITGDIVANTISSTNINAIYANVLIEQQQRPPIYGNVILGQTQANAIYGNVLITQGQIPPLYANVSIEQQQRPFIYGNVISGQTQTNALYGNVSLLQIKTTAISYIPTTTTINSKLDINGNILIQGNTIQFGQIDASNLAISGFTASANSLAIGDNLVVGNNIVNSGSIFTAGNVRCNRLETQNLIVNSIPIRSDTQLQLDFINNGFGILSPLHRPVFNLIDPSGLQLYYPFTTTNYFNSTTRHIDGIRVGNLATGTLLYDASLTGLSTTDNSRLTTFHTAQPPVGQHGLVINRTVGLGTTGFGGEFGVAFSLWFMATSIPSSTYWFITTIQDNTGNRCFITIDPTNRILVGSTGLPFLFFSAIGFTVQVNVKYHLVVSASKMYINGVLNGNGGSVSIPLNTSGFNSIMRDPLGYGLIGTVDDYRYYNRPLSPLEVTTLYSVPPY